MVRHEATAVQPPVGNHGGSTYTECDNTAHEGQGSDLRARAGSLLLDYLRVRFVDDADTWAGLDAWLGERSPRPFGWRGWYDRSASVLEGGLVGWCGNRERAGIEGVLVDLPGRACASLGDRLIPFLRWCLDRGKVTRVDYAIDDTEGRLTRDRILDAEADGSLVMRWRGLNAMHKQVRGSIEGWTIYLGSRKSEAMIRIYDKAAERRAKRGPAGTPAESWVRLEFETKGDLADALAREYFDKGASAVVGQIARRVRFTVPSETDSNKRRWPAAPWWASLLGSVRPGPSLIAGEVAECTVDRLAAFVELQAGPALATVVAARGGDLGDVLGILRRSRRRLRPKHRAALAAVGVAGP